MPPNPMADIVAAIAIAFAIELAIVCWVYAAAEISDGHMEQRVRALRAAQLQEHRDWLRARMSADGARACACCHRAFVFGTEVSVPIAVRVSAGRVLAIGIEPWCLNCASLRPVIVHHPYPLHAGPEAA